MLLRRLFVFVWMLSVALLITSCDEEVTGPDGDVVPPLVSSVSPLPDAVDVPVDAPMTVQFNEPMAALSPAVLQGLVTLSHGTVTSVAWTSNVLLTISHTPWPESTLITATFAAAFEDTAGNTLSGSYSYDFTTAGTSVTVPTVVMTQPGDGYDRVWSGQDVRVTFSEAMDPATATGNVTLSHGTITDISWPQPHIMVIQHDEWPASTEITVTIGDGLTAVAGESLAADFVFSFTTDTNTVSLMSHVPADGAVDVPLNVMVALEFSREMDEPSLVAATSVTVPDKGAVPFIMSGEWETWMIEFLSDLPASTVVTVTIGTGAQDQHGQALDQEYQFSFTTGTTVDTTPPQLLSTVPTNGAIIAASTSTIVFTFDEAIDDYSLNPTLMSGQFAFLMWSSDMEPQWNAERTVITVDLATPLAAGTTLMVAFDSFADISGNVNTDGFVYGLTVEGTPDFYPVIDGQWYVHRGSEESNDPAKVAHEYFDMEQIEVTNTLGDFLIKRWDEWSGSFRDWDMMTRNASGILFRGFHETDWDSQESFDIVFSPFIEWMRFPVAAETWSGTAMFSQSEPGGADRVEYDVEYLNGTFDVLVENPGSEPPPSAFKAGDQPDLLWIDCRKAVLQYSLTDGSITFSTGADTLWYAPGVGLVREVSHEEETGGYWRTSESSLIWSADHVPFD